MNVTNTVNVSSAPISTGTTTSTQSQNTVETTSSVESSQSSSPPSTPTGNYSFNYDASSASVPYASVPYASVPYASVPSNLTEFIITEPGITIQGDSSGITLDTYSPVLPDISFNLSQEVTVFTDSSGDQSLVEQIKMYAGQIKCTDFYGKGTIDDYAVLFDAASRLVNETKHVELDVQVEGFNEFAQAADDLSSLFASFTKRLQSVSVIEDTAFLTSILNALRRIVRLTEEFGKFKETIKATNTIQLSNSVGEAKKVLEDVTGEISCAMNYITHFTSPDGTIIPTAELSNEDKNAIQRSVQTLNAWSEICNHGVSIAMVNDPNIQYIQQSNQFFSTQSSVLRQASSTLRGRYAAYF
jgi:hypothetical protein